MHRMLLGPLASVGEGYSLGKALEKNPTEQPMVAGGCWETCALTHLEALQLSNQEQLVLYLMRGFGPLRGVKIRARGPSLQCLV